MASYEVWDVESGKVSPLNNQEFASIEELRAAIKETHNAQSGDKFIICELPDGSDIEIVIS